MTKDEALRKAQAALGCHVELDDSGREWCNHPDHSNCPLLWWHVTDVLLNVDREARAAALDEAAAKCEANAADWYGTDLFGDINDGDKAAIRAAMQERGKDIDNVAAYMFRQALHVRARILRDRARAIRGDER